MSLATLASIHFGLALLYMVVASLAAVFSVSESEWIFRIKTIILAALLIVAVLTANIPAGLAWLIMIFGKFIVPVKKSS